MLQFLIDFSTPKRLNLETHIENIFLSGLGVRLNVHRYSDKRDDILKMCLWILLHYGVFEELFYLYQSFFFNILSIIYNTNTMHISTWELQNVAAIYLTASSYFGIHFKRHLLLNVLLIILDMHGIEYFDNHWFQECNFPKI